MPELHRCRGRCRVPMPWVRNTCYFGKQTRSVVCQQLLLCRCVLALLPPAVSSGWWGCGVLSPEACARKGCRMVLAGGVACYRCRPSELLHPAYPVCVSRCRVLRVHVACVGSLHVGRRLSGPGGVCAASSAVLSPVALGLLLRRLFPLPLTGTGPACV